MIDSTKINAKSLKLIDFNDFPVDDRFPQIEGKLFIADNLDISSDYGTTECHNSNNGSITEIKNDSRNSPHTAPVRLSMTVIFTCLSGQMKLKINLKEYTLTKNTEAILLVGSFMQIMDISDDFKGVFIAIANDFMNFGEDMKINMTIHQHTLNIPFINLKDEEIKERMEIYRMMKRKLMDKNFQYKFQTAKMYLELLKYNGFQSFYEKSKIEDRHVAQNRKQEIFIQFIRAVQKHYKKERLAKFYANHLLISPKYLSTIIHDVSGKYATQWIHEYIILDTKALLKNSTYSIKEICAQLHFANQSMFSKYFKRHTGMTPKEFRNS